MVILAMHGHAQDARGANLLAVLEIGSPTALNTAASTLVPSTPGKIGSNYPCEQFPPLGEGGEGIGMPVVLSLTLPFPTLRSRVVTNEASAMIDWTHAEPYGQQPKAKNLIPHVVSTPRGAKLEFHVA